MRIQIVEDEPKTGDCLHKGLRESGFNADLAGTGPDGLHMALEHDYDLVVLDVMLPKMDGWTVLDKLCEHKQTPVLFEGACTALLLARRQGEVLSRPLISSQCGT